MRPSSEIPKAGRPHFAPKRDISRRFYVQTGRFRTFEEGCGSGREELTDPLLSHPKYHIETRFKKKGAERFEKKKEKN